MKFKEFLLLEQREFLGEKVGDILTAVQELVAANKQVGARQLVRNSELIVNQIRKILHSSWPRSEYKFLKVLQKCGVAIMKAIDEKGDLREVLQSVEAELENLGEKIGTPINQLATPREEEDIEEQPEVTQQTQQIPPEQMPQQQQMPPEQMPQQQPQQQMGL